MSSSEPNSHGAEVGFRAFVDDLVREISGVVGGLHLGEVGVDEPRQTGLQGLFDGIVHIRGIAVHLRHVHEAEGAGVIDNGSLHAPFVDQDFPDERSGDAGDAVVGVVGGHQGHRAGLGALPKTVGIVVAEQFLVETGIRPVAVVLVAVRQEVLHQGRAPPILGVVALDALHLGGDHFAHQVRVFAETLLGAAPARVAGDIGIRGPENQRFPGVVLGIEPGLIGHDVADDTGHFPVPGLADAVGLREGRAVAVLRLGTPGPSAAELAGVAQAGQVGVTAAHDAVDGLRGAGAGDAEARNAHAHDRGDLLIDGHQGNGVVQPFLLGELRILERIFLCAEQRRSCQGQAKGDKKGSFHKGMIHCSLQI